MKAFIDRFSDSVKGVLSGFDRIVFKGLIRPLMSATEVMSFLCSKGVLNKDYKKWIVAQTKEIINTADQYARDNCGQPIVRIPTWRIRKEELAHERQQKEQIETGLIGEMPMNALLRHAHIIGTSTRVLRYLDRPLTKADCPDARSNDTVVTRMMDFNDSMRIRIGLIRILSNCTTNKMYSG